MSNEEREHLPGAVTADIGKNLPQSKDFLSTGLISHDCFYERQTEFEYGNQPGGRHEFWADVLPLYEWADVSLPIETRSCLSLGQLADLIEQEARLSPETRDDTSISSNQIADVIEQQPGAGEIGNE